MTEQTTEQETPDPVTEIFRKEKAKGGRQKTVEAPPGPSTTTGVVPATPSVMARPKMGHSSYWVFSILGPESSGGQAFKRVAPGLRQPKKNEGMILLALVLMSAVIGSFGGVALYGYTHPPIHLVGVCQPPAILDGGSCYTVQTAIVNQQTTTIHVAAGYLIFPNNGTRYGGR